MRTPFSWPRIPPAQPQNGTGVFTQTGGSIGKFAAGTNNAIGIFVGGSWAGKPISGQTGVGSYNLQNGLIVGGCETVGGDGTGTFTQSGGTNAFVGNGDYDSTSMTDYNNHFGDSFSDFVAPRQRATDRGPTTLAAAS